MAKPGFMLDEDFKPLQRTIVLLQGRLDKKFFDTLKDRREEKFFIMEGRPSLEAAQSNCSRLNKIGITPTLICDNMAGFLFAKNCVKEVWAAYDHIEGEDVFVSIGGSILSVLCLRHQVPIYAFPSGRKQKPLADGKELLGFKGIPVAAKGTKAYVPLLESVPKHYLIIKEEL